MEYVNGGIGGSQDSSNGSCAQLWCPRKFCLRIQQVLCSARYVGHGTVVCNNRESRVFIFVKYDAGDPKQFCGRDYDVGCVVVGSRVKGVTYTRGNPTRFAPIPNPAPVRAEDPTEGA
jgi:hypothetical protein